MMLSNFKKKIFIFKSQVLAAIIPEKEKKLRRMKGNLLIKNEKKSLKTFCAYFEAFY